MQLVPRNNIRVNHDPSIGNDNIGNMRRAIGYEHKQVNAIRVIAGTKIQEKSKSPKSEESSPSGNKKKGNRKSKKHQAKQETLTTGGLLFEKASSSYEVTKIEAKNRLSQLLLCRNITEKSRDECLKSINSLSSIA